ncbi:MAG: substrate-binding domain-containing protein [Oscillospiraceae bacterium]|nr:substrate-binding domain-containing protein [Oscillospiraceae bacterium]
MAELILAADISLKNAIEDMAEEYSADTGDKIKAVYDDAGYLAGDIACGKLSPDLFIPSAMYPVDDLIAAGKVNPALVKGFVGNRLVIIQKTGSGLTNISCFKHICAKTFDTSKVKFYMANPDEPVNVPAGRYTHTTFDYDGNWDFVNANAEKLNNTTAVLNAVADAAGPAIGIVYFSDAIARPNDVTIIGMAPEFVNSGIIYPIARLDGANNLHVTKLIYHITTIGINYFRRRGFTEATGVVK